ncbi:alanine racemase [Frigidibacter sp. ROC022]|uniref:alanine racemase n=1 Tax=Frigidibacter sp. ROC022 TaxID=2971796 RepID=UPI00215A9F10|nr:alanine racemase [Frigidibacter sp. ROC022]MCR8725736.1 alanine racemase [Frigidibacter sp. ROC022]
MTETLTSRQTPFLALDLVQMKANVAALRARLDGLGVPLRPHLKTVKCIEAARHILAAPEGPATVSTLQEAEAFAGAGLRDMIYTVGIAPGKLDRVIALRRAGVDIAVILDSLAQAQAVAGASRRAGLEIPALIEIDSDGARAGIRADNPLLTEIGGILHRDGAELRGVLTHAGASYACFTPEAHRAMAETERRSAVTAAEHLRTAGLPCPVVSVGSSPTAHTATDLSGVTEVRAGVFTLFDLMMVGLGICDIEDIAASVIATVIGHQPDRDWIVTDAGYMALSRDDGTASHPVHNGFGLVCDLDGRPYPDLIVRSTNQEHGILTLRPGSPATLPALELGARVRILPIHACATVAMHPNFAVLEPGTDRIAEYWPIMRGW